LTLGSSVRVGPYEILSKLGEGGMGEVYRARDTKLNRDVALKVLPEAFALDPDRLARFRREAQVLASLNHPNIAAIYGFEDSGSTHALVLELVDGQTLADRIAKGPIPVDEALPIATHIADALEAAHEQGIIHRDLKPANIKLTASGKVKVLDFGLAKMLEVEQAAASMSISPTVGVQGTFAGVILGTASYMSPEQARGRPVDQRTDIWSFGCVLFEMLAGRQVFGGGETVSDAVAAILTREPDWSTLPRDLPTNVLSVLRRCLQKDASRRVHHVVDAKLELEDAVAPAEPPASSAQPIRPAASRAAWIALPLVAAMAALAAWLLKPAAVVQPTTRLSIALPAGEQITTVPAISRDGRTIAYAAGRTAGTSQLYLRALGGFTSRAVVGGAGAQYPFFSPDGASIGFFAGGKMLRAPVAGGAATVIAPAPAPWGGTWGDDGRIVYAPSFTAGIWRVPIEGGKSEQLTMPDGEDAGYAHVFPQSLPGTSDVLFSFWGRTFQFAALSMETKTWRDVTPDLRTFATGTYSHDGHLIMNDRAGGLRAAAWRPTMSSPVLPETVVVENVNWNPGVEIPWIAVSPNGTAVYAPGNPSQRHLVWVDRNGVVTQLPGEASKLTTAAVSHDGRRVAYSGYDAQWIVDLATGARTRLAAEATPGASVWLPGDERLMLSSNVSGDWDFYAVDTNGRGGLKAVFKKRFTQHPMDIAPDGTVVYLERHPTGGSDLWLLSPDGKTSPLAVTAFNETSARFSPDGRYVAYASDESGRNEVYAIPTSGKGERVAVSVDGGTGPVWSRDGRELFYRAGDDLISAQVKATSTLGVGERRKLLDLSAYDSGYFHEFDVSADGQRFLLIRTDTPSRPTRLDVILNWFDELKQRVPAK
jgi:eukaryotic-like serine/threonine-protein kinase